MKRICLAVLATLLVWPAAASAHDVPDLVKVSVFLKPEDGRMLILVRMPANALIDFLFPSLPDGWLDLTQADATAAQGAKVWIADMLSVYENDRALQRPDLLAVRVSQTNDLFFDTFKSALDHVNGKRLPAETLVTQDQVTVDALLQTPISSANANFSFEPRFARLGVVVDTVLTFVPAEGGVRRVQYQGDPETFELNPGLGHTITHFIKAGIAHYFSQTDYLLFTLCVALVFRRFRALLPFAVVLAGAASLCLLASLASMFSAEWIHELCGVLIAAATVYMGIEAIVAGDGKRAGVAIGTGLILGCGFWFGLQPILQFGGTHLLVSSLGFDAGVVISELATLALVLGVLQSLLRLSRAPRVVVIIAAAVAIHVSWRRMLDRADGLALISLTLPAGNVARLAAIAGGTVIAISASAYYLRRRSNVRAVSAAV